MRRQVMPDVRVILRHWARASRPTRLGRRFAQKECKDDVARFFMLTRGHVIMCGPRTARSFPDFARHDRTIVKLRSYLQPEEMIMPFPDRVFFIRVRQFWAAYAHLIRHWGITKLPYDGGAVAICCRR